MMSFSINAFIVAFIMNTSDMQIVEYYVPCALTYGEQESEETGGDFEKSSSNGSLGGFHLLW